MSIVISNAFMVIEGRPVTSSRIVAEYFGKKHSDAVRAIDSIIAKKPELLASRNFAQWSEEVEIGSGAKRTVTGYWMDQKGFCILAMGFTGAKALEFKCAFYDEFERMKNELEAPATITPAEQLQIQKAVARRAKTSSANYQTIYRAIKVRYKIAKYDQLPRAQFEDCLRFIESVELSVPDEFDARSAEHGQGRRDAHRPRDRRRRQQPVRPDRRVLCARALRRGLSRGGRRETLLDAPGDGKFYPPGQTNVGVFYGKGTEQWTKD